MKLIVAVAVALSTLVPGVRAFSEEAPKEPKKEQPQKKEAGVSTVAADEKGDNKTYLVEILEISGEIGESTVGQIARAVEAINEMDRIKAVLVVLNSPGGGASASAASYEELSKIKVPVVVWCDQVCASGAYYIAMSPAVKYLGVRAETVTGSVGVVAQLTRYSRLLEWAKIDNETFISGSLKDAGNPTRAAQDAERKYIQGIVTGLAERFYEVVGKSRKITDWDSVKTGRIFFGYQAVKLGLVDGVVDRDGAIKKAKALSGQSKIYTREEMKKMSRVADAPTYVYRAPAPQPTMEGDLHNLVGLLMEIREGRSTTFAYRLPYRF